MLILDENGYITKGHHRFLFIVKDFPGKCLKVASVKRLKELRNEVKAWYKKIRPLSYFNDNIKDLKGYKIINKKSMSEEIYKYVPRCYGVIKTNIGNGILVDYIDNAIELYDYLRKYGITMQIKKELEKLFSILYDNNIQVRDLNLHNFMVEIIDESSVSIKLVDGISNAQLIPIANWFPIIGKIQFRRRFGYFIRNVCIDFPDLANEAVCFKKHMLDNILCTPFPIF